MANLFNIGTSALLALQQQLATTSHNISNATRPEYSRQRVAMVAQTPQRVAGGYIGGGVSSDGAQRTYDAFLVDQIRAYTALTSSLDTTGSMLTQINLTLGDAQTGLSAAMDDLFAAFHDLAASPGSEASREVLLGSIDGLVDRFHGAADFLDQLALAINRDATDAVARINTLAGDIATTNQAIVLAGGVAGGALPNDLLDQQDALLWDLAQLVDISVVTAGDGSVDVFIGNGQSLVLGGNSTALTAAADPFDAARSRVLYGPAGADITTQIGGGELGGLLQVQANHIDGTRNRIGQMGYVLAASLNSTHRLGMDANGLLGGDLFALPPLDVAAGNNAGTLQVAGTVVDIARLTASDYRLHLDAAGDFILTRLSDASVQNLGPGPGPFTVDGVRIDLVGGVASPGDSFLIRPTAGVARGLQRAVGDASALAAAAPITTGAAVANTGNGTVSHGAVIDTGNPAFAVTGTLSPPIAIRFLTAGTYEILDNTNPGAPLVLETAIPYTPGGEVFPSPGGLDFGYRLSVQGAPAAGDLFTIDYNTGGIGDNRNALALADRQAQRLINAGAETYQGAYASLVGALGAASQAAEVTRSASQRLLDNARDRRDSVSGVNLDEEAANLLRFQQAYEAAAQTLRVGDTLFETLMDALG